jgi:hypothetical protein
VGARREAPNFETRSKITALFFEQEFKERAAAMGVSIEWIDIGTWKLPSENLIHEKHKKAWELSRQNAVKRNKVTRSKKEHEVKEILKLVENVVIRSYEKKPDFRRYTEDELKNMVDKDPKAVLEYRKQLLGEAKRDSRVIALEMLNAFRMELRVAHEWIKKENKPLEEKSIDLINIEKAIYDISQLTPPHWIKKP